MPDTETPTNTPQPPKNNKKILSFSSIGILIFILLSGIVWYIGVVKGQEISLKNASIGTENTKTEQNNNLENDPFYDMTIPYLRSKSYQSKLGPRELIGNNSFYTSYLTSYTSDGLKINGLLTVPSGETPPDGWPAIVFIHGYIPPSSYTTTDNYIAYINYLASQGFVVLKIDLRGHANSEGEASGAYYSGDYVVDTINAYKALQGTDFVNPKAVGLWGHSMAGNVILRSMAALPEIPAIVVWGGAVYTYSDMAKYGIDDNSYRPPTDMSNRQRRRDELRNLHGEFDPSDTFWKTVPATNYLSDIKGAIQLNHTVDDPVVNVGYSRDLNTLLDTTLIPHELHEYDSGGHNFTGSAFNQAMQNTTNFYKNHLSNK